MACEHTPGQPRQGDYFGWYAYAERMSKTHRQQRCPTCGLWAIWVRKAPKATRAAVNAVIRKMEA